VNSRLTRYLTLALGCLLGISSASAAMTPAQPARTAALQHQAATYRDLSRLGPDGKVDVQPLLRALAQRQTMLRASSPVPISWTFYGPSNIGGRVNAILTDPAQPSHLIAGTAGGGLFVSTDSGSHWQNVNNFLASLAVSSLARAANGTLYAGTGDQFNDPRRGVGILSSSDGGATWKPLAATNPANNRDWFYVNHIAISTNGTMLVATGVPGYSPEWGAIYRSTDGGQTFTSVAKGASLDVVFDPNNPNDAVAEFENGKVMYSTDAGSSWKGPVTVVSGGGRITLGFAHDSQHKGWVYALIDNAPSSSSTTNPSGEIYVSKDAGQTGSQVSQASNTALLCSGSGSNLECQGNYDNTLWVDPSNALQLVAGGIDVFRSADGGASWKKIGSWQAYPKSPHADQHVIVAAADYNGTSNTTVYVGNDGGIWKTSDISTALPGFGWTQSNSGLAVTQFYHVAGHAGVAASNNQNIVPVLGGAQDNGTELYDATRSTPDGWSLIYGGDGGQTAVNPNNSNYLYGEYVNLALAYSTNGGLSMQAFSSLPTDSGGATTANFIAPFTLVPGNPNAMLAGGQSLWYGTQLQSGNPSWNSINGSTLPITSLINAIGISPSNDNAVWVGLNNGQIWASSNAMGTQPTWAQVGKGTLPAKFPTSIDFQPGHPKVMAITYGARSVGNIWISSDGGLTWTDVGQGLPPVPVESVAIDPTQASTLYAGTEVGLFVTTDNGQTWSTTDAGPANVTVNQVAWFSTQPRELLLATNGRGIWHGSVDTANPAPTIGSLTPGTIAAGAAGFTVTVSGSGFVTSSVVNWNGTALNTSFDSATQVQAQVPASMLTQGATIAVTVTSPAPGGGTSAAQTFTVTNPTPTLSTISPSSATAGATAITLVVNGTNFVPTSIVEWNGAALATTYVSASTLQAQIPTSDLSQAGSASVLVSNPTPAGGTSSAQTFTVANPTPTLSTISPSSATAGAAAMTLVVNGTNFVSTSIVEWNGAALATTYVSASTLQAQIPASDLSQAGNASVLVSNPTPVGGSSSSVTFTILAPPSSGNGGSGGGGALGWPVLLLLGLTTLFGLRRFRKTMRAE